MSFTGFYRVLPSFTEFYRVLPGFTAGGGYQRHLERRRYSRNDFSQSLLAFFCLALFFVPVSFHCPVGEPPKKREHIDESRPERSRSRPKRKTTKTGTVDAKTR